MKLSICVPTWNRGDILAECLARLPQIDCEVVISDNASPDDTPNIVRTAMRSDSRIRYTCLPENRGTSANLRNAVQHSTGDLIVYLADDDSLLAEPLALLCGRMDSDAALSAIFCDHINWDDAEQRELHRYFPQGLDAVEFDSNPLEFINFILESRIPPEIGVFRRDAFLKAQIPVAKHIAMEFPLWAYGYFQAGKVRFDPMCFYREHWVLKPHLKRTAWTNQEMALEYAGDQQRIGLRNMLRLALRDYGHQTTYCVPRALDLIEHIVLDRSCLETNRAIARGDFLTAVELRRHQALMGKDAPEGFDNSLALEAAKQALAMYGDGDKPTLEQLAFNYRI